MRRAWLYRGLATHRLEATLSGSTIAVRWDGVLIFTATGITSYQTSTHHGLLWHSDDGGTRLDTFTVDDNGTGGGGSTCTYSVAPTSLGVGASGTSGSFSVTTQSGCFWAVDTPATWVSLGTLAGTGSGTVPYTVAAHTGSTSRSALVVVESATLSVTQTGVGTTPPPPPSSGGDTPAPTAPEPPAGTPTYYALDAIGAVRVITTQSQTATRFDY